MKILVLHEDYDPFLEWLYSTESDLASRSYDEQLQARKETYFAGTSLFYTKRLTELGHEARTLYLNNEPLQKAWAREHGLSVGSDQGSDDSVHPLVNLAKKVASKVPFRIALFAARFVDYRTLKPGWYFDVLTAQIEAFEPDVILNKGFVVDMSYFSELEYEDATILSSIGRHPEKQKRFVGNDAIISHIPGVEEYIRECGYPSLLLRHAFAQEVANQIDVNDQTIPVSFIGSLSPHHEQRIALLEHLCQHVPVEVWAPSIDHLAPDSPIRNCYNGVAWGREMYNVIARSKISINKHVDTADSPGNLRLFEATGMGSMLLTDARDGMEKIFEPGQEVVTYDSPVDCIEQIEYYLEHESEREAIASAGRQRTHGSHTYEDRTRRLLNFIEELDSPVDSHYIT